MKTCGLIIDRLCYNKLKLRQLLMLTRPLNLSRFVDRKTALQCFYFDAYRFPGFVTRKRVKEHESDLRSLVITLSRRQKNDMRHMRKRISELLPP